VSSKWYHKKRNEANGMCALKKEEWRQIEENQMKNKSRKFFSEIKKFKTAEYKTSINV